MCEVLIVVNYNNFQTSLYKNFKNGKNGISINNEQRKEERKMNTGAMKNIVILKDLPSNLVEEAIVFLKENQKIKSPEVIDRENKQKKSGVKGEKEKNEKDYIINEARLLIADYISRVENNNQKENLSYKQLKKKYKSLKKVTLALAIGLATSLLALFAL